MKKTLTPLLVAAIFITGATGVLAQAALSEGTVRKVDKENSKITLRHGEIKHLDMPAMTMVFTVKDPALLDKVKQGDKVRFQAENEGGKFTVTDIQSSN